MLEKIIKKDINEELEKILENKKIDEQAKNLLQGILYKVEVSYNDYKKVKGKEQTEEKYVKELLKNISKKCEKISIVNPSQELSNKKIQKELEKNKFYVDDEIISYPIEEKILYAIEKKSRYKKILNNKYEEKTIAISDFINEGKNMDRIEVLRDFNGWSWTTVNKEIENIEANLVYQTLQILLGEKFLDNWTQDKDGIIDYLEQFEEDYGKKYGEELAINQKKLLIQIALASIASKDKKFKKELTQRNEEINQQIDEYQNTKEKVIEIVNHKKDLLQELNEIEKILGQEAKLKEEFCRRNEDAPIDKKIFNIKVLKLELSNRKKELLEGIEQDTNKLNPFNYLEKKAKIINKKEELQYAFYTQKQLEELLINYVKNFLECYKILIKKTSNEEKIIKLIYKFRYFMQLPFNQKKNINDIKEIQEDIVEVQKSLIDKAIQKEIIIKAPFEVLKNIFETRILILQELYYKITKEDGKYYVQLFDENVSEEKFEIVLDEKTKINKKKKFFI